MSFLNHKNNREHILPDVFTAVKHGVMARQVAEMYGIQVNSHGMACCPFHDDTHPSMKLDERYYCFGCHASGDAIDFVSNLLQIGKREAALMEERLREAADAAAAELDGEIFWDRPLRDARYG